MQEQRFIVVGMQRSGTTVTHVCLAGHAEVTMGIDEVYAEPFYTRGLATFTGGKESFDGRRVGYQLLFDALARSENGAASPVRGIKTALRNHDDAVVLANCLREYLPDVAVVVVSRDDLVAQYGSLVRAEKSGEWHRNEGGKSNFDGRFVLGRAEFESYAKECLSALAQLRTLARTHRVHEINYERDIVPGTGYEAIFEFLGVSVVAPSWLRMSKVAPPPGEFISNYDELVAAQAKLSVPSEAAEIELAREQMRTHAKGESSGFLLHRAIARCAAGHGRERDACEDVMVAMASKKLPDIWLRGACYAAIESACADLPECPSVLRALAEGVDKRVAFALNRSRVRLEHGAFALSVADALSALGFGESLSEFEERHAFDLLELGLDGLKDLERATQAVDGLMACYSESSSFWSLRAGLQRAAGDLTGARESVAKALRMNPGSPKASRLSAELDGDRGAG